MTRKTLKVALLQETDRGSRDGNLDAIEAGLREAAKAGVELVLLQELHNGPYFCQRETHPGREVVQVPCRPLIWQNGSLHCITMQLPAAIAQ